MEESPGPLSNVLPSLDPAPGGDAASVLDSPSTLDAEDEGADPQEVLDEIEAEAAAEAGVSDEQQYGRLGRRFDRRSPFYIGLLGASGVALAAALAWLVVAAGHDLILFGLAFFIAVGLDPAVTWLDRRGLPRWAGVVVVLLGALGIFGLFLYLAIPVLVTQATQLGHRLPGYLGSLNTSHTAVGRFNLKYHIVPRLQRFVSNGGTSLTGGVVGAGRAVLGGLLSTLIVLVVSIYLLADMPRFKRGLYQMAPRSRRARMVLLTDEILSRVGGYVLGKGGLSVIAGVLTYSWAMIFGIPYPVLLALLVALVDLVPIVGSIVGGVIVVLAALAVSFPVTIATIVFYLIFLFAQDYFLIPRIMGRTVDVPGLVTIIATLIGGALLGIIGALVAIPVAAAVKLLLKELAVPRLEES